MVDSEKVLRLADGVKVNSLPNGVSSYVFVQHPPAVYVIDEFTRVLIGVSEGLSIAECTDLVKDSLINGSNTSLDALEIIGSLVDKKIVEWVPVAL